MRQDCTPSWTPTVSHAQWHTSCLVIEQPRCRVLLNAESASKHDGSAWHLMGRIAHASDALDANSEVQLRLKIRALRNELDLPEKVVQQRLAAVLTLIPGLERTFMDRQVKLLAALIRELDMLPAKMVRNECQA
jgi:hypothetical protein